MNVRKFTLIVIASSCLCTPGRAQELSSVHVPLASSSISSPVPDFSKTVIPITELKLGLKLSGLSVDGKFGTGFCLDMACRFIGTNYHVAMTAQPRKIKGETVIHRYVATGPNDEDATLNDGPSTSPMKYTISRDLAIFELRHPLRQYHGAAFSLNDLQFGQEVDIYAYPKETVSPFRSLTRFHGAFRGRTTTGLLAFDYNLSADNAIRPGASGGIVVDSKTQQIVGILNGIERNGEAIALAVSVDSLADFVSKVRPYLAQSIFPLSRVISPVSADIYSKFVPPHIDGLQQRPEESAEVKALRSKSQLLADSMRDFIALQTFAWGSGDNPPASESTYELRILDGHQQFRRYPNGKKELRDSPLPPLNTAMSPGPEWSDLPAMVGSELDLHIHQAPDVFVNNQKLKVFQYWAYPEDEVCKFKSIFDFVFIAINKVATVGCYGEVWTDEDTNIVRMSEHLQLLGEWKDYDGVVTYGWFHPMDQVTRRVPLTISTQARYKNKIYWCRGQFTDYQVFTSQVKIAAK